MAAVFVHGVPETFRIWDSLRAQLARNDTHALALPGFDAPLPDHFEATKEHYAEWIVRELEALGAQDAPVDLVGHDWGSILVQRVASTRPELVRTLACGGGPIDREYVWHDLAQLWQTPGTGEEVMAGMTAEATASALAAEIGPEAAAQMAEHIDDTMKSCILTLYRSAISHSAEWQDDVDALGAREDRMPVLVVWGRDDIYAPPTFGRRLAERLHGEMLELDCGHFWPILRAERVARALEALWERG